MTGEVDDATFFEHCVAPLIRERARKKLGADSALAPIGVRAVVRACRVAYNEVRADAPDELRIPGITYATSCERRLLAARAFVVLRPHFEVAVAGVVHRAEQLRSPDR